MIAEYQRVTPLTLGELWAIPAMLRMGYLESVRRMALRAARDVADRASADEWVSRLLAATLSGDVTSGLSAFVHRGPDLTPAFLTRFLQQIRSRRSDFTPLLWLEQWVAEDVMTVEDAAQRSVQELALTQLVMANSIASLAPRHQHRLDGVRRGGERDRGRAARGSRRDVRRHDTRDARSIPPRGGTDRQGHRPRRAGGRRSGRSSRA